MSTKAPRAATPPPPAPQRRRRSKRREQIIAEAVRLFRERGYHAVGIDDIGAAAGITGPGVYRHFRSKQDLLAAVVWQGAERFLTEAEQGESGSPRANLERLIDEMVDVVVDQREMTAVYVQEFRHLSETDRARLRVAYLRYLDDWVEVLRQVNPGLNERESRVVVEGIVWLVRSVAFYQPQIDAQRLKERLRSMATAACLADGGPARRGTQAKAPARAKKR